MSVIKNHQNHCVITKSSTAKSVLLGDSIITGLKRYDNIWKKYFSYILNFGIGGDPLENAFWRGLNLPKMPYLGHVIILCGTNNIKKDLSCDIEESSLIEIGKYFQERSLKIKSIFSAILP